MNKKSNAKLKDEILKLINNNIAGDVNSIANNTNKDIRLISYLLEQLESEKLVELIEISRKNTEIAKDYVANKTNKGIHFVKFDGGHLSLYKQERLDKVWLYTKTTAAFLNAIAILLIGYFSL